MMVKRGKGSHIIKAAQTLQELQVVTAPVNNGRLEPIDAAVAETVEDTYGDKKDREPERI